MIRPLLLTILIATFSGVLPVQGMEPERESDSISAEGPIIGVLLSSGIFDGSIEAESGALIVNWRGGQVSVASPLTFQAAEEALRLGDRWFREPVRVRASRGDMQIGHRSHEGWVEWLPDTNLAGGWKMIERLPMERYLIGVVSREMSASTFPAAALEAQAVAARTYCYFHYLTGHPTRRYHVYGDTRSQAYGGTARVPQKVIDAVKRTEGMILLAAGQIFESFYHSTCGGQTSSAADAFGIAEISTMPSVSCSGCEGSKYYRWTLQSDRSAVRRALQDICEGTGVKVGVVNQLIPIETASSGHVPYLKVVHSAGSFEVDSQRLRSALSSSRRAESHHQSRLRSSRFQVRVRAEGFLFEGSGWGHGVGMCQVGARGYALRGANRTWILQHYYPGVQIRRMW